MKKKNLALTSAIQLHTAAIDRRPVIAFIGEEPMGRGVIESVTDHHVKIGGEQMNAPPKRAEE
jgi:hypothetical protein